MNDQNTIFGLAMLVVGVALILALDPWFIGIVFVLIGVQRLVVARGSAAGPEE